MTPLQHLELLLRYDRGLNLRASLQQAVAPGRRVLDAGCGTGLISLWAALAGAAKVVAVDLDPLELAIALSRENQLVGQIEFIQSDLWKLDLVEFHRSFDVIVAMVYLNDPRRDEAQVHLAASLRDRFLAPNGTMIPDRVRYTARACDWPAQDHITRQQSLISQVRSLEGRYGLRFQALEEAVLAVPWHSFFPRRGEDGRLHRQGSRILSHPATFWEVNYHDGADVPPYPDSLKLQVLSDGRVDCVLWTQELWHGDRLLFANESLSWVANPQHVLPMSRCELELGADWRERNLVTLMAKEPG